MFRALGGCALVVSLTGCLTLQKDHDALVEKTAALAKSVEQSRADITALRGDLEATRARLDNALRANADTGSDLLTSKQRINDLAGRTDELGHSVEELRRDLGSSREEIYARIDDLKRAQPAPPPPPPPPTPVPADKAQHFAAVEDASAKKDWPLVRTLGQEFVNRYASDDKADDALFLVGDADLSDGRPTSALGHFNRLLKLFPHSNVLDRTLFDMGEAYLALHDCANAKLAFSACESRFAKEKIGLASKQRLAKIAAGAPGLCAPP